MIQLGGGTIAPSPVQPQQRGKEATGKGDPNLLFFQKKVKNRSDLHYFTPPPPAFQHNFWIYDWSCIMSNDCTERKVSGYHADTPITIKAEAIHKADSQCH